LRRVDVRMVSRRHIRRVGHWLRRVVSCVALLAYLGAVWGYPLPATVASSLAAGKDTSVPYPCMNNACGCRSAADCWASCCCYTLKQRVAWAVEHNVPIPDDAARRLAAEMKQEAASDTDICSLPCLDESESAPCCPHCAADKTACATQPAAGGCGEHDHVPDERASEPAVGVNFVLGVAAAKCQGLSTEWTTSGAVLLPKLLDTPQADDSPAGRVAIVRDRYFSVVSAPPVPPPRAIGSRCV
jgi:hypothetical protein